MSREAPGGVLIMELALALALAACGPADRTPSNSAGGRLEAAARSAGLVTMPSGSLVGSWARDSDRVCIVDDKEGGSEQRIGIAIDYGEGQTCIARGIVGGSGDRVRIAIGACRFDARYDGDRLTFPAEVPGSCDTLCNGRASIAALSVERLSATTSEARMVRAPNGTPLCS